MFLRNAQIITLNLVVGTLSNCFWTLIMNFLDVSGTALIKSARNLLILIVVIKTYQFQLANATWPSILLKIAIITRISLIAIYLLLLPQLVLMLKISFNVLLYLLIAGGIQTILFVHYSQRFHRQHLKHVNNCFILIRLYV